MAIKTVILKNMEKPVFHPPMDAAFKYCKGKGIEIGAAAHNPFNLTDALNLAIFSKDPNSKAHHDFLMYQQEQVNTCGSYARIDIAAEAHLLPLKPRSQNYVISSHVIEHIPDLISAFLAWDRILKPGGTIFIIFPKRDAIHADSIRPLTPLDHFIEDFKLKRDAKSHPLDPGHGFWGHYHVFSLQTLMEITNWCRLNLALNWKRVFFEETDSKVGNGHTIVFRKKRSPFNFLKRKTDA